MPASGGGVLTSEYGPGPIPGPSPESSPSPGSGPSPSSGPSTLLPVPIDVWRVNTVPNIQETVKGPTGASSNISLERASNSAKMRIIKLEKSLVWLQQQHRQMLADLFNEIETMKNKNRELQFQLLMSGVDPDTLKQTEIKISRISSDAENKVETSITGSRYLTDLKEQTGYTKQLETLNLQMKEMQRCLIETRSRNLYLENLVEQQRKKLEQIEEMTERAEKQKTERSKEDLHKQVVHDLDKASSDPDPPEVLKKLTEAEEMLIRLREENVNQREELDQLKSFVLKEMRMKYKGCNHPTKLRLSQGSRSTSITRLDISQGFPPLKPITVTPRRTSRSMNRGEGSQRDIFNSSFSKQRIHASLPSLQLSRRGTPAHR